MEKFRNQIHKKCSVKMQPIDNSEFLFKLETRIKQSRKSEDPQGVIFVIVFFMLL